MAKLKRTLIIGLGGTGFNAILNAKKMIYDNYGEIPPMVAFLGIDTDKAGLQNAQLKANDGSIINLNASEQLDICVSNPSMIYQNSQNSGIFDWIPQSNVSGLTQLTRGAGQMRSNGRFAITVNERRVEDQIVNKINEVHEASVIDNPKFSLIDNEAEVHIVFSIGGGTGCGTFLNLAYLIKRLYPRIKTSGYAVLPDVFKQMQPGAGSARVRSNGKGALMDLDFLAHLSPDSTPVELKWFHTTDHVKERPFTALYLVDNRNSNNDTFSHVDPICKMLSLALVNSVGQLNTTLASIADNVDKLIADGAMDIMDKKAWVASLGCSEIVFDSNRLANIYEHKAAEQVINKMLNGGCDDPGLIANAWFDNNHIRENNGRDDIIDYFMTARPKYTLAGIDAPDNAKVETEEYLQNRALDSQQELQARLEELKSGINASLSEMLRKQANSECGVFLCEHILKSILHEVELCDNEMKSEMKDIEDIMPKFENALTNSLNELKDIMRTFFKSGKKDAIDEICSATMNLAVKRRELLRRSMARQFYSWLRSRLLESLGRVDVIMANLNSVRQVLSCKVQEIERNGVSSNFFEFDLATDAAKTLICEASSINFNDFIASIRQEGGVQAFATMTTEEIKKLILRFTRTLPMTMTLKERTLDEVLKEMSDSELEQLISRAVEKARPLLSYSYGGYEAEMLNPAELNYYIGVADAENTVLKKAPCMSRIFSDSRALNFCSNGFKDRIIIYTQLGVIPMFAVTSLQNYSAEYDKWESAKPNGSHWDAVMCERMRQMRFSLLPRTTNNNVFELWVKAIILDIIRYDAARGQYRIACRTLNNDALDGYLVDMGSNRKKAYMFFEDNIDVLEQEIERFIKKMDVTGPENRIRIKTNAVMEAVENGRYMQDISKCPIPIEEISLYPDEKKIISDEINYITDNLA